MHHFQSRNTDFDFLLGSWSITIFRRRCLFQGCDDWESFEAHSRVEPILGGSGHIEHITGAFPDGTPLHGMNIRLFNPRRDLWTCQWSDSRSHELHPATLGQFIAGKGVFYGATRSGKTDIEIRSKWLDTNSDTPRWEQEMSIDGGLTWESNWAMEFKRVSRTINLDERPRPIHANNQALEFCSYHPN